MIHIEMQNKVSTSLRISSFCSALLLGCVLVSFGQKTTSNFYPFIKGSTKASHVKDSLYYFVEFVPHEGANEHLGLNYSLMRRLSNGMAIVQGVKAKDSLHYHSIHNVNDLWKLSHDVAHFQKEKNSMKTYTLKIRYALPRNDLQFLLGKIKIRHVRNTTVLIESSFNDILRYVLPLKEVVYVGDELQQAHVESRVLDLNLAPNKISYVHHTQPALTGSGLTASIKENSFDVNDIDLQGRSIPSPLASSTVDLHATEMATLVAGAGNSFVTGRGVATTAQLTSSSFEFLAPDMASNFSSLGISVQNHSYGTEIENVYGALAELYDESTMHHPFLLHVFSSGNNGLLTSSTGTYAGIAGFANLTGNFKMAKNVLTVGSVDTLGRHVAFSSRGPAYDGRIKPELVAYSTAGSSNSAALVSGVALLLQQKHKDLHGSLPTSDLVRALLLTGANEDAGSPGIDFSTGYGNLDAEKSLSILSKNHYLTGEVAKDQVITIPLVVPASARNLKVTLTWNDTPAHANDAIALVNDLDLKLTTPQSQTILPWKLNPEASLASLTEPAFRGEDHLNNNEQISLANVSEGDYSIAVMGFALQTSSQKFSLAYDWEEVDTFNWFFPTGSDNMPYNGETGTYFQWKNTSSIALGRLEYSINNGVTWILIKDGVELSKGLLRWNAPALTAVAKARMIVGTSVYETESFTISRPVPTRVGFNCTDSAMLTWQRVPEAISYRVNLFSNAKLQEFIQTADTSLILDKTQLTSSLFSIQPILQQGYTALAGYTFDFNNQGVACYLSGFFCELRGEDGIRLRLQVGTTYGIQAVVFERLQAGSFVPLQTTESIVDTQVDFIDTAPLQGLNTYRARIMFVNGGEITSETSSEYFLTTTPFLLFPNPVAKGEDLQIIAKQFLNLGQEFILYSSSGAKLFSQTLFSDRESVTIPFYPPGIYLYSILTEEGLTRGKLVIQP